MNEIISLRVLQKEFDDKVYKINFVQDNESMPSYGEIRTMASVVHLLLKQHEENEKLDEEIMEKSNFIHDKLDKADARHEADAKRTAN